MAGVYYGNICDLRLPCPCVIWNDALEHLPLIRDAINTMCEEKGLLIRCKNVTASITHEFCGELMGSYGLELAPTTSAPLEATCADVQKFLLLVQGTVEGTAPDFVKVRVIRSHSHVALF